MEEANSDLGGFEAFRTWVEAEPVSVERGREEEPEGEPVDTSSWPHSRGSV